MMTRDELQRQAHRLRRPPGPEVAAPDTTSETCSRQGFVSVRLAETPLRRV